MFDIVIPVFNEAYRLPATMDLIASYAKKNGQVGRIILVDDHSTDSTAEVINYWVKEMPTVVTATSAGKGKGSAVQTGMLLSEAEYTLFTDADLSTPIECVENLLEAMTDTGVDLAIGSRHVSGSVVEGRTALRGLMSWGVNKLDRILLGNAVRDSQCGFKLFNRRARETVFPRQTIEGFGFDMELLAIARLRALKILEVPVVWKHEAQSRIRPFSDSLEIFKDMLQIRSNIKRHIY